MKLFLITLLFSSTAAISTATEVWEHGRNTHRAYNMSESYHSQSKSAKPMVSPYISETYFSSQNFETESGLP